MRPMSINYRVVPAAQLHPDELARWRDLQRASPQFESPFFSPEFTQCVARVRPDARVAILEQGSDIVGFFPFHRAPFGIGEPIGGRMSDYHGVVSRGDTLFDPVALIRACGLRQWRFDHLVGATLAFDAFTANREPSPTMNLQHGFAAYRDAHTHKTEALHDAAAKLRKLRKAIGDVRFEAHTTSRDVLAALARWKSQQYIDSSIVDNFGIGWINALVEEVTRVDEPAFGGMLSALYAGDTLVAVHLGMRSHRVWHYWLATYSREHSKFSPGLVLVLKMAEHAPTLGLSKIDFGKGDARYKRQLANDATWLGEGAVDANAAYRAIRIGLHGGVDALRRAEPIRKVGSWCRRRWRDWFNRRRHTQV